jgi:hypothetical protein
LLGLRRSDPKLLLGYASDELVSCYLDQLKIAAKRLGHTWNMRLEPVFLSLRPRSNQPVPAAALPGGLAALSGAPQRTCQPSFDVSRTKRIVLLDRLQARLNFRQLFELTHPAGLKPLDHVLRYADVVHRTISLGCQGS